ncbi:MAG: hypothetical protein FWH28_00160 [Clostridiales bacterium]|nr:hypothetical protein [Clostridiales bacterium]
MGLTTPNPVGIRGTYAPIDTSDSGLGPKDDVAHPFRFAALRFRSVSPIRTTNSCFKLTHQVRKVLLRYFRHTSGTKAKLIACLLVLAVLLSACKESPAPDGGNTSGVISPNASVSLTGTVSPSSSVSDERQTEGWNPDTRQADDRADPRNDRVSRAALTGSWTHFSSNQSTSWVFNEDGRFAGYLIAQAGNYYDYMGYIYYRSSSAYKHLMQGRYEVSGGIIRFFDCQLSTTIVFDTEPWHQNNLNDAMDNLLFTRLDAPSRTDDFTAEFEFIDARRLRIRLNRGALEEYDMNFKRETGNANADIPPHRIPPAEWPAVFLSPEMPVVGDSRGRIRSVSQGSVEDLSPEYQYIYINVDRSSQASILDYAAELRKLGWSGPSEEEILIEKQKALDSELSIVTTTYSFRYRKGVFEITLYVDAEDEWRIYSHREAEGFWPSELFGDEFRPPANAVFIGVTDMNAIHREAEGFSASFEIDFYPGNRESYFQDLLSRGFVIYDNMYGTLEMANHLRINGRMYQVVISPGYYEMAAIGSVTYRLTYYPDMAWSDEFPSETAPPPGYELFWDYYDLNRGVGVMNAEGDRGNLKYSVIGLTQADLDNYYNNLEQMGWSTSWMGDGKSKPFNWNGGEWWFQIRLYRYSLNLYTFELDFWKTN